MSNINIKQNSIFNILKILSTAVFPLVTFPYVTRVLGVENVGRINFGESLISYINLLASLGISSYAIRECAKVKDNKNALSKIGSELFSINLLATIFAYIILFSILFFSTSIVEYRKLLMIQSLSVLLLTLGADWLNTAMEDLRYVSVRTFFFQIIAIVLMFIFVRKPEDYYRYAVIMLVSSSLGNLVNIFYRAKYCNLHFTFHIELKKHFLPICFMFSSLISQIIYTNSDIIMIKFFHDENHVGIYSVSVKIYNIVNMFVASINIVILPKLSGFFKEKNYSEANKILRFGLNFIVVLGLPCIVALNLLASRIIELIAGKDFISGSLSLHTLTIALAFSFVGGFFGSGVLIASGKEKIGLISSAVGAVSNLTLNFIFIPKYGITAAAATTAVSEFFAMCIVLAYMDKNVHINSIYELFIKPIIACIVMATTILVISQFIQKNNLTTSVLIVCGMFSYLFTLLITKEKFLITFLKK